MHRENTLFYKVVKQDENHATELFCNLLKYDYIRNFFLSFFNKEERVNIPIDNISYDKIDTQYVINESNKRPDVVIETYNYKCFFEIKVNNNTELQESQLNEYPEGLKGEKNKNLIFIIPENYTHKEKIEELKKENEITEIFYWENFIKYVENSDLIKTNIIVQEFIMYLKKVIKKEDLSLTLNLKEMALLQNPKDLVTAINLHKKLKDIIDKCSENVKNELQLKVEKRDWDSEYSYTFQDKQEKSILFFGLWYDMVNRQNNYYEYLLCYGIGGEKSDEKEDYEKYFQRFDELRKNNNEIINEFKEIQTYFINNFDKYDFAEENEDKLINNISNELIKVIKILLK